MKTATHRLLALLPPWFWIVILAATPSAGQEDGDAQPRETGWFNTTELSLVLTEGNSNTNSLGIKNVLTRAWERDKLVLKLDAVRSDTADDRFLLVEPGLTFLPGETPDSFETSVVSPPKELDVEKFFVETTYTRSSLGKRTWNAGISWDRNEDAGILNRFIGFGGAGHVWLDGEKLHLETGYAFSFTDREEETPDPEKEDRFGGFRLTFNVDYGVTNTTSLTYGLTGNLSLKDTSDYSLNSTGSMAVKISERLSLAVSLQFLFNSEPALEDVDVVARIEIVDPDGVSGSGDEFFRTVESGGAEFEVGEDRVRLESLDTVIRTSLVIEF